ncbi:hypothetical protein D3C85_1842240 [compost metagenome]
MRATSRLAIRLYCGLVEACILKFSRNRCSSKAGSLTWIMLACENADSTLCVLCVT